MGQRLKNDKIGQLSEAGGLISLAPSVLTIGGQQYSTSALTVAANLAAANSRYQIYAVENAGVVSLRVDSNENSVGPSNEVGSETSLLATGVAGTVAGYSLNGSFQIGQTFTTTDNYEVSKIDVQGLSRVSGVTGDLYLDLYTTSGGEPDTLIATSAVKDVAELIEFGSGYETVSFNFAPNVSLVNGTVYAFILRASATGNVNIVFDNTNFYAGGTSVNTSNGGSSWIVESGEDIGFEIFNVDSIEYNAWKLVGSYYTGNASSFGSFVNISGVPRTDRVTFTPSGAWTVNTTYDGVWWRDGNLIYQEYSIETTGAPNAATFGVNMPFEVEAGKIYDKSTTDFNYAGYAHVLDSGSRIVPARISVTNSGSILRVLTHQLVASTLIDANQIVTNNSPFTFANDDRILITPDPQRVVAWSNTPIEDL